MVSMTMAIRWSAVVVSVSDVVGEVPRLWVVFRQPCGVFNTRFVRWAAGVISEHGGLAA
jgi:hypothetical protein